ncbi:MAG: hypothetical protein QCI00_07455 [Candidatus Thermoplasmatota archaeon]|nr:hypothetical protein [Candidatus Thermoplasmatota archaeon]
MGDKEFYPDELCSRDVYGKETYGSDIFRKDDFPNNKGTEATGGLYNKKTEVKFGTICGECKKRDDCKKEFKTYSRGVYWKNYEGERLLHCPEGQPLEINRIEEGERVFTPKKIPLKKL